MVFTEPKIRTYRRGVADRMAFSSARHICWSNRSNKVVLTHSIQNATRSVVLELGDREVRERNEWSDRLNQSPQVSVLALNSDDTRIASVSADWRVRLLDAATLSIIPSAIGGEDDFQLPKGFQPNSVIFGPKEDELTLMSWRGARVLDLQTRKLVAVLATFRDQSSRRVVSRGDARDRLVATSLFGKVLVARAGESPAEPIVIRGATGFPRFNPDGNRILVLSGSMPNVLDSICVADVSLVRRSPTQAIPEAPAKPAPPWLAELAAAASALDVGNDGSLITLAYVRDRHPGSKAGDPYEAVWKRYFP